MPLLGHESISHDAYRYEHVSFIFQGILMLAHISKSARYLVMTSCFSSISGCSSDGGLSELAAMGMLVGGAATGDSGLAVAGVAGYVGVMLVAPLLSDDSETGSSPYPSSVAVPTIPGASAAVPTTAAAIIAAEVPDAYRNESCDYLEVAVVFAYERLDGRKKANDIEGQQIAQARIAARSKAMSEKKCPPSTWVGGRIGISMDNVDPRYVAMYKIPAEGAMVLSVAPKGSADKAGIKVGDVITEVNGKPIRNAIDLRTVLGHAPIGSVQNLKLRRDTKFMVANTEVAGPANPLPTLAFQTSSAIAPPLPVQTPQAETSKPEKTRNFCLAYLAIENTYGAVISPIQEKHDYDGSSTAMLASLKSYIAKVKQVQPGAWGEFDNGVISCESDTYNCMAQTKGGLFTKKQTAGQFCHYTRAEAELELAGMHKGDPSSQTVAWP